MTRGYIEYNGKRLIAVHCKAPCETIVARPGPGGAGVYPTDEYREIALHLEEPDGLLSKHETAVCRACFDELMNTNDPPTPQRLESIYAQDVMQWEETSAKMSIPPGEIRSHAALMRERKVIGIAGAGRGDLG